VCRRQIPISPKTQTELREFPGSINAIAASSIETPSYEAPRKIKTWWENNMAYFAKADRDLAEKYKKEDAEAAKNAP